MVKVQVLYNKDTNSISMIMNRMGITTADNATPGVCSIERVDDKNIVADIWIDADLKSITVEQFLKDVRLVSNTFADTYDIITKGEIKGDVSTILPMPSEIEKSLKGIEPIPKKKEQPQPDTDLYTKKMTTK